MLKELKKVIVWSVLVDNIPDLGIRYDVKWEYVDGKLQAYIFTPKPKPAEEDSK